MNGICVFFVFGPSHMREGELIDLKSCTQMAGFGDFRFPYRFEKLYYDEFCNFKCAMSHLIFCDVQAGFGTTKPATPLFRMRAAFLCRRQIAVRGELLYCVHLAFVHLVVLAAFSCRRRIAVRGELLYCIYFVFING